MSVEKGEPSAWYRAPSEASGEDPSLWYRPAEAKQEKAEPGPEEPNDKKKRSRGKNRVLKRVMIALLIVLVAVAVCLAVIPFPRASYSVSVEVTASAAPETEEDKEEKDAGSSYAYSSSGGTTSMARYISEDKFNLKLVSTAGKDMLSCRGIYDACINSVVVINAWTEGSSWQSWGTGIVMSEDGYIVTNDHIIEGLGLATVELWDGSVYDALLVGEDEDTDIAVLKIEADGLTPAEFGLSSELHVGDDVCAIGNPLSRQLTGTMTSGIVSAINRDISTGYGTSMTLIQTDAALNEGNSGGPLFNMYGQVVGITNMKLMTSTSDNAVEGIGFAIPSATIEVVAEKIIADSISSGKPGIGIVGYALTDAQCQKYSVDGGVYVSSVTAGTDAFGKLEVGDIVTAVNGTPVSTVEEINEVKADLQVGDSLEITFLRDGKSQTVNILLVDMTLVG